MAEEPSVANTVDIPDHVVERLRIALSLPDEKLRKVNDWVKQNYNSLLSPEITDPGVAERLGIRPEKFYSAITVITSFIYSAGPTDLAAYLEGLKSKGVGELVQSAKVLLGGIKLDPKDVDFARHRAAAVHSVGTTLSNVECVCDLRAIFRRLPSPSQFESHLKEVETLMGFEPVVLVNLELNTAAGEDEAAAFQVSEQALKHLLKTLQQALKQLEVIKESASILRTQ